MAVKMSYDFGRKEANLAGEVSSLREAIIRIDNSNESDHAEIRAEIDAVETRTVKRFDRNELEIEELKRSVSKIEGENELRRLFESRFPREGEPVPD